MTSTANPKASSGFKMPAMASGLNSVRSASSGWRDARSLAGLHDNGNNVAKSLLRTDISIEDSSCICVNNNHNYIVQGGTSGRFQTIKAMQKTRNDMKQYSGTTTVLDKKDCTIAVANVFTPTFSGSFPGPIHCMDMVNEYLLVGSNNGDCFLKTLDVANEKNNCTLDFSANSIVKCVNYSHTKLKKANDQTSMLTVPSPEQYTFSTKINNVQLQPCEKPTSFHTIENNRIHIWSIEKEDAPVQTMQGSRSPLWCSSWSPHNNNLILIGGVSKAVKLLDTRNMNSKSKESLQMPHGDAITDVKWNPLLPYWIASSSTDGLIYIWDQRYTTEPIMILEGHNNVVKKLSWSHSHVELLASGGIDHCVKLWSLRVEPHHVLTTLDKGSFSDSIVGVNFSKTHASQFFAQSASGELVAVSISPSVLDPLVQSRLAGDRLNRDAEEGKKDPELQELCNIERNIYHRNLNQAFTDVEKLAIKLKEQNKLEKALKLLDLCKVRVMPSIDKTNNPKARFKKELEDFSYFIPPNISYSQNKRPDEKRIDDLVLNCKILRFVQRNEFTEILSLEKKLLDLLKNDNQRIEMTTIKDVISLYLANDYRRGMSLAIDIANILKDPTGEYQNILKGILSPTIFEVSHNQALRESGYRSLAKAFQNQEYIIEQLQLQRDVVCALWEYSDGAKKIVNFVGDTYLDIISVSVLRSYLNALLCQQMYDKFFIVCTKLLQKIQGYDIALIVRDLMKNVAFADFLKILNTDILNSEVCSHSNLLSESIQSSLSMH